MVDLLSRIKNGQKLDGVQNLLLRIGISNLEKRLLGEPSSA
jgi:hypothetical protein